jgi:methionine sulfoxide reductase heme-binding subunit
LFAKKRWVQKIKKQNRGLPRISLMPLQIFLRKSVSMNLNTKQQRLLFKALAQLAWSLPLVWLTLAWMPILETGRSGVLGINPVEYSIRFLGEWALNILLATLAITPLARSMRYNVLTSVRRLTGLWAFAYALLHLLMYFGLDLAFSLADLWDDVVKRVFITAGMAGFVLLLPLALTSTAGWIKRLGARRWQQVHRLVYAIGILGVLHYSFMVKGNQLEPKIYAGILFLLLALRIYWAVAKRVRAMQSKRPLLQTKT